MAVRANVVAQVANITDQTGGGINYLVQKPDGTLYCVFVSSDADVYWKKSADGGLSWTRPVSIYVGTILALSVWYDRWSGIDADRIHIAYIESGTDDARYRTLNAADDSLSTEVVALAGTVAQAGAALSICRARGGNVYMAASINGTTENGFMRLPNANVPNGAWDAARAAVFEGATTDQVLLLPGFNPGDSQDMICMFIDANTNELTRKVYDDSANSWSESSAVTIADVTPATSGPHWAATVDLTNSKAYVIFWNAVDAANQDLLCYRVDESELTALTPVVADATDDCGKAALCLDQNGVLWAFWAGITTGGQTWGTAVGLYAKTSADLGATWSSAFAVSERVNHSILQGLFDTVPRLYRGQPPLRFVELLSSGNYALTVNTFIGSDPHGRYQMGM